MPLSAKKKSPLLAMAQTALDTLLPPRCIATGEIVDAPGMVSPAFWSQLSFIEAPHCATCGLPFAFEASLQTLCAACIDYPPAFDTARSAVVYNDSSREVILGFKYGDRLHAVDTFVPWMQRAGKELLNDTDIIIPVPLHQRRLWERRFNQSALLAEELADRTDKKYFPDALLRLRHTVPQQGLNVKDRNKNVKSAFGIQTRYKEAIKGKNILLIDDVFTSGATLNECARTLKKTGAEKVFVLTIARVTRAEF